jgi:hypothetical protein
MGNTVETTLRFEGSNYEGTAMLETSEIIFRGQRRLVIPLSRIKSVKADKGDLTVRFDNSVAVFELGPQAVKWVDKIKNPKTVLEKLGVRAGQRACIVEFKDPAFVDALEKAGVQLSRERPKGTCDLIFYGVSGRADLKRISELKEHMTADGAVWVLRPKGSSEVTEADVMAAGKKAGLVDVKVVRFSETHTAEKFVIPRAKR